MGTVITSEVKEMNIDKNVEQNEKVVLSLKGKSEKEGFKALRQPGKTHSLHGCMSRKEFLTKFFRAVIWKTVEIEDENTRNSRFV